jgi:hypothetical protein
MIARLALLIFFTLPLGFPSVALSKCAELLITIDGEIRGQPKREESVMVDVLPDSFWSFQLAGASPTHFVVQVPFDTFSGRGPFGPDRCTRRPKTITLMLQDWLQTVDGIELQYPDDFIADHEGNYRSREKVVLDVNHVGPPWIRRTKTHAPKAPSNKPPE